MLNRYFVAALTLVDVACADNTEYSTTSTSPAAETKGELRCDPQGLPPIPNVRYTSVERLELPVPHCAVSGVIVTETGHRGHPIDGSWALNHLERIVSFGYQAVHRTAITAKALAIGYYGESISRRLFVGCSRGGGHGLMEAQRYPEDFDCIVAMAPAYDWTGELVARNVTLAQ